MNPEQFENALKEKGIELTKKQLDQFAEYYKILVEWNEKINLTALTSEEDVYLKHFYDSISASFFMILLRSRLYVTLERELVFQVFL